MKVLAIGVIINNIITTATFTLLCYFIYSILFLLLQIPYSLACPAMKSLLEWCGPEIYNGPVLPWEQRNRNSNINGNNKYRNQISNLDNIFQANFTPLAQQPIKNTN